MERIELQDMTPRAEGCTAILRDDGMRQEVPTCMGGAAIVGCVDFDNCGQVSGERWDDPKRGRVIQRSEDGTVISEVTVRRGSLTTSEVMASMAAKQAAEAAKEN